MMHKSLVQFANGCFKEGRESLENGKPVYTVVIENNFRLMKKYV